MISSLMHMPKITPFIPHRILNVIVAQNRSLLRRITLIVIFVLSFFVLIVRLKPENFQMAIREVLYVKFAIGNSMFENS